MWVFFVLCLAFFSVRAIESIDFHAFDQETPEYTYTNSIEVLQNNKQEKKQDMTYILIVGRWGGEHDAPNLTDTIMLAGINRKKESITLFSIPRDLWIKYPDKKTEGKINRVYEKYADTSTQLAITHLKNKVSQITGKHIDYYASVDFEGFIKVIDILGWVEVTLEKNFVDYQYPDDNLWYKTFILRRWTWTLDGEVALMYARSRHSSSDFDRSLRQQEIISSLKDKIGELGYISDAGKIMSLYNTFTKYVDTDLTLKSLMSLGLEIRSWDDTQTLSFNLNDTCYEWSDICDTGWFLYVPMRTYFSWASVLLPHDADSIYPEVYDEIHNYVDYINTFPEAFLEEKNIHIYNAAGIPWLAGRMWDTIQKYGFSLDPYVSLHTLRSWDGQENVIYINTDLKNKESVAQVLQDITGISPSFVLSPTQKHNAEIEIILTQDTKTIQ